FRIEGIRAEGLVRMEEATVYSYLPLAPGDELNAATSRQAIRALYRTGLFDNVVLRRDGNVLIVEVSERPLIASFEIEGNDKVSGDEFDEALRQSGLVEGEVFRELLLDQVEQEIRNQYFANGYYSVLVETTVTEEPNNRVRLKIDVTEGRQARIRDINIVGNTSFDDETLLDTFELEASSAYKFFQSSDKYSKQALLGDLESLNSWYKDRGFLRMDIDSVQVALAPDRQSIYVTINVDEGEVYRVRELKFAGELVVEEPTLRALAPISPDSVFSLKVATDAAERMTAAYANIGYAFAEVNPVPEPIDGSDDEIVLTFLVDPGPRNYVRRINFSGHLRTNDETLRREMRQFEGAVFSQALVERSRTRLARLPFIQDVQVTTDPVPGSDDLVDINFTVEERAPGSVQFGVGFSGSQGFLVNGSLTHTNFLGTGNRLALQLENNQISDTVSVSWTDPYVTPDGISRTLAASYRKSEGVIRFSSGFDSNTLGLSLTYGIPISEFSSLRAGLGIDEVALNTFAGSTADEVLEFVARNGSRFTTYELRTGFTRDTRNRTFFASRGALHRLNLDVIVPGSDIEYFKAFYTWQQYAPLFAGVFAELNTSIGMVEGYGDTEVVPPYENFFVGGTGSVRGFRAGTLGPRDSNGFSFGGTLRTSLQANLIIPTPLESDGKTTRFALFYDTGQVFARPRDFDGSELRSAAGVAFEWFTPFLGLLELSYAFPLESEEGDREDRFQINFGTGF
ncbi:MAG: outer membrane protein assembly factor BamA, partial [Oceanococcaceae bacterium]